MEAHTEAGTKEKRFVALTSVVVAIVLTGFKAVVGIMTGSLGILAEAAHSGLDLIAAVITYWAVCVSGRPADEGHPYGHGKIENISALIETLLLLITCAWILHEAIDRLFFRFVHVDASTWAFIVMFFSIFLDFGRSRALSRAAKKYNSQALEADALHFRTDIWSSAVVIIGLIGVKISDWMPGWGSMHHADPIASIGVAVIVVWVSLQLGKRTLQALIDTAPAGLADEIKKTVERLPGVVDCQNVRVRPSGPQVFVDAKVLMGGRQSLEDAHKLTEKIEESIQKISPGADITLHPEPTDATHGLLEKITQVVQIIPGVLGCHDVEARYAESRLFVEMHVFMDGRQSLQDAHDLTEMIEQAVQSIAPDAHITIHPEPFSQSGRKPGE